MTGMADLLSSSLASDLSAFLRNPVIKLMPADEVAALQIQLRDLQQKYDALSLEYKQLLSRYGDEVNRCMALQDLCRHHSISWR